jgi:DNA-binding CsgD family transcriptional regulator
MSGAAVIAELNALAARLSEHAGMVAERQATTLEDAVEMSAQLSRRLLAEPPAVLVDCTASEYQRALTAFLSAQVEAHRMRSTSRSDVIRSLTEGIRRMRKTESLQRLGRQARLSLCETMGFDRALLSFVEADGFVVEESEDGLNAPTVISRRHCAPEQECIRTQDTVEAVDADVPATSGYRELMGTGSYLVAPVLEKSRVVALLHVSKCDGQRIVNGDADVLDAFATAYSLLYEKIRNAERLQQQRISIAQAAARLAEQADRIALEAISFDLDESGSAELPPVGTASSLTATLSDRERDVFERLVLGASNADIADALVITVETVKTHVKRILRKIGAVNRAEAIALYLDATKTSMRHRGGEL